MHVRALLFESLIQFESILTSTRLLDAAVTGVIETWDTTTSKTGNT